MRIATLSLLLFSLFCDAQNPVAYLQPNPSSIGNSPFLLLKTEDNNGIDVIRRISREFVVVRNTGNLRTKDIEAFEINDEWKWADTYPSSAKAEFYVVIDINPIGILDKVKFIEYDPETKIARVDGSTKQMRKELLTNPNVTYIQKRERNATVESQIREHNMGINNIRYSHSAYPTYDGSSSVISIKEESFDTLDIDIRGRSTRDNLSDSFVVGHATDMATLVAGGGNSYVSGRGVAYQAQLYSETFDNLFPAANQQFTSRGITIQNHSYGVGIENYYGLESVAFDEQAQTLPYLLHVFSAGNSGSKTGTGTYTGINRYGTLTGSFKQAKNVLLVTSSDEFGNVLTANSAGPAYDGRIKPELSAFGKGGTSDAAAVVSGASALIQSHYKDKKAVLPSSDMTKAVLIAGANDLGTPGPDFFGGYGQMNLRKSMEILANDWLVSGTISDQETNTHQITVDQNSVQLTAVLAWRDPAANNGDGFALINDLDLRLEYNGDEFLPWVLDDSPSQTSLSSPATRGVDRLNNIEVIRIDNPSIGTYTLNVSGFDVTGTQEYAIAYYIEAADAFTWTYPTINDPQEAGTTIQLYFDHTFGTIGSLEWDDLSGNWTSAGIINPNTRTMTFTVPQLSGEMVLKATFGPDEFKSDTFFVGTKPQLKVALLCDDELVVNWEKTADNTLYELLHFETGTLVSKQMASDTFAIIDRNVTPGLFFTVREVGTYANGLPDETIRVDQQAVGCYLNNFLVSVDQFENVNLNVSISLPQFIETLRILKIDRNDSVVFTSIAPNMNVHSFVDSNLTPGMTSYYAQLITKNGAEIWSERFSLFTTNDKKFILFPNPVIDGFLNLLSPEPNAIFQILQLDGIPIREFPMGAKFESFPIDLSKGTYLYRVIKGNDVLKSGKFVVGS
jgi:hypothetical protein